MITRLFSSKCPSECVYLVWILICKLIDNYPFQILVTVSDFHNSWQFCWGRCRTLTEPFLVAGSLPQPWMWWHGWGWWGEGCKSLPQPWVWWHGWGWWGGGCRLDFAISSSIFCPAFSAMQTPKLLIKINKYNF